MDQLRVHESCQLSLYDSIKEFPVWLQLEARQYALLGSALASSTEELAAKHERLALLQHYDQIAAYQVEAHAYAVSERLLADGYDPMALEWACYVQAVNGERLNSYMEEDLLARLAAWQALGLNRDQIAQSLASIKEAMQQETKRYYPGRVGAGVYNQLQRYKAYGLALADCLADGSEESRQALDRATLNLLTAQPPLNLTNSPANGLVSLEKSQFKLYTILTENGVAAPDQLSVYGYYGWLEVLEERSQRQAAALAPAAKPGKQ